MNRVQKIQYEMQKIKQEKKPLVFESRFISDFKEKKQPINSELSQYLKEYYEETEKIKNQ